jgi:cysteine desulfurase
MDAPPERVFFTSGGTEANNWAIKCGCAWCEKELNQVLSSWVEHASILHSMAMVPGSCVGVDDKGTVKLDDLEESLKDGGVGLVSIQHANNEVGTIQPVQTVIELCKKYEVLYHMDAVQSYGKFKFSVRDMGVDMATVSGHKIHGPMGVGALYVAEGVDLPPFLHGGGQEQGMRSGTMAVPLLVGFGKAAEIAWSKMGDWLRVMKIRNFMEVALKEKIGITVNGNPESRLPNISSMTLPGGIEAVMVAAYLDRKRGMCVACGSACGTRQGRSHVLEAMGISSEDSHATLRLSLSRYNTMSHGHSFVSNVESALLDISKRGLD